MKESQSQTLWNEETKRRCGVIDNVSQTRKDEGKPLKENLSTYSTYILITQ
jgi:hypothetical protein